MATPRKSNKQLTQKYRDNLANYRRLWTGRRALAALTFLTLVGGVVAVWYYHKRAPDKFFNPGPVSSHHINISRAQIGDMSTAEVNQHGFTSNCDACHDKTLVTGGGLTARKFVRIVRDSFRSGAASDRIQKIDNRCEACHLNLSKRAHTFHEPNAIQYRCSTCHEEHRGPGPMKLVTSSQCASCHGNATSMQTAAKTKVPDHWSGMQRHPQPAQRIVFNQLGRPAEGYTKVFSTFWDDHPEFQINVAKAADPQKIRDPNSFVAPDGIRDILRFNHSRHFRGDIPAVDQTGKKLDCNYCHQLETEGRFMKRISFQAHCQTCHQLQFDLNNPDLTLPHGDPVAVLGFLRSVKTQYEDLARRKNITDPNKIRRFVEDQMKGLAAQYGSDDRKLLNSVFFEADPYKIRPGMNRPKAANFAGCAYCHQVAAATFGAPTIIKPVLVDRWMVLSDFDHAKHVAVKGVQCETCHAAARSSSKSSDILLPAKASCVKCHSPHAEPGLKTAAECITCHKYHAPIEAITAGTPPTTASTSLKDMLLAGAR